MKEGTQNNSKCILSRSRCTDKTEAILRPWKRREEKIPTTTRTRQSQLSKIQILSRRL